VCDGVCVCVCHVCDVCVCVMCVCVYEGVVRVYGLECSLYGSDLLQLFVHVFVGSHAHVCAARSLRHHACSV